MPFSPMQIAFWDAIPLAVSLLNRTCFAGAEEHLTWSAACFFVLAWAAGRLACELDVRQRVASQSCDLGEQSLVLEGARSFANAVLGFSRASCDSRLRENWCKGNRPTMASAIAELGFMTLPQCHADHAEPMACILARCALSTSVPCQVLLLHDAAVSVAGLLCISGGDDLANIKLNRSEDPVDDNFQIFFPRLIQSGDCGAMCGIRLGGLQWACSLSPHACNWKSALLVPGGALCRAWD